MHPPHYPCPPPSLLEHPLESHWCWVLHWPASRCDAELTRAQTNQTSEHAVHRMHKPVPKPTAQHGSAQHCIALNSMAQHGTAQHGTTQPSVAQRSTAKRTHHAEDACPCMLQFPCDLSSRHKQHQAWGHIIQHAIKRGHSETLSLRCTAPATNSTLNASTCVSSRALNKPHLQTCRHIYSPLPCRCLWGLPLES